MTSEPPETLEWTEEGYGEATKCVECERPRVTTTRCNIHALEQRVYSLESDLARVTKELERTRAALTEAEGVIAKVEAYLDGPMPEGMSFTTSFTRRAFIIGVDASRLVVRAILSGANKEA